MQSDIWDTTYILSLFLSHPRNLSGRLERLLCPSIRETFLKCHKKRKRKIMYKENLTLNWMWFFYIADRILFRFNLGKTFLVVIKLWPGPKPNIKVVKNSHSLETAVNKQCRLKVRKTPYWVCLLRSSWISFTAFTTAFVVYERSLGEGKNHYSTMEFGGNFPSSPCKWGDGTLREPCADSRCFQEGKAGLHLFPILTTCSYASMFV